MIHSTNNTQMSELDPTVVTTHAEHSLVSNPLVLDIPDFLATNSGLQRLTKPLIPVFTLTFHFLFCANVFNYVAIAL